MPRDDYYYQHVKIALERDGWTITHDPYPIMFGGMRLSIDLGAEKLVLEKGTRKIAVEIKNFRHSKANELAKSRGQYANYRDSLARRAPDRDLYLAIPKEAYRELFSHPDIQAMMRVDGIRLIIFDPVTQTIIEWKD